MMKELTIWIIIFSFIGLLVGSEMMRMLRFGRPVVVPHYQLPTSGTAWKPEPQITATTTPITSTTTKVTIKKFVPKKVTCYKFLDNIEHCE